MNKYDANVVVHVDEQLTDNQINEIEKTTFQRNRRGEHLCTRANPPSIRDRL